MFQLEMLAAAHGDGIWIEYGTDEKPFRILLDGGPASTYEAGLRARLALAAHEHPGPTEFELFVVTHIDADHIDVPLILLRDDQVTCRFKDIWFNGFAQITGDGGQENFAPLQGEFLTSILGDRAEGLPWNVATGAMAVVVPEEGPLPVFRPGGGMKLTLLSPGAAELKRLRARWTSAIRDFTPGDMEEARRRLNARKEYEPPDVPPVFGGKTFGSDRTPANGSSVAFLAEFDGKAVLLAGDAHARVLARNLRRLAEEQQVPAVRVDAFKLPHHGSMANLTAEVLDAVTCSRFLFSTSGAKFKHPDPETVDLILRKVSGPVELIFNYRSNSTAQFEAMGGARFTTTYGESGHVVLDVAAMP